MRGSRRAIGPSYSFNGAAADQPRKYSPLRTNGPTFEASMGPRLISRGNGDRSVHARRQVRASMGPRLITRGNVLHGQYYMKPVSASMGPRLISRGNPRALAEKCPRPGFNGAAADQPRKSPRTSSRPPRCSSFNGAAADQPRKFNEMMAVRQNLPASM